MKIQLIRLIGLKNFVLLFLVSTSFLCHPVKLLAQDLRQLESERGKEKVYYGVGDQYLTTGLDLIDRYWSEVAKTGKHLLRGHLDNYLPIALKSLNHEPSTVMMRSFADYFFAARNPDTGLIPYSYGSWLDKAQTMSTKNKQPVGLIAQGVELCQWFPEDMNLQNNCLALAADTIEYFDGEGQSSLSHNNGKNNSGLFGWVDVETGSEPRILLTLTHDYGAVAKALAYLAQKTDNPQLMQWADQKLEFVWQNRMNPNLPLLNEQFIPSKALLRPEELSSDTDTLYYVQQLFELYELTGNQKYRNWAIAVTNLWYEAAWNEQWGHFIRKLNPDGTPAVDTLYGDGKYNTLYILIYAYEVTQDVRYLNRFQQAWNNFLQMGNKGLAPSHIHQGKMIDQHGLDKQQTIFLDLLVAAYEASGDQEFLQAAEELGQRIIDEGESVMRLEGSQAGEAFLRLALARQKIRRLKVKLEKANMPLRIKKNNQTILDVIVPSEVAVVYLPEGNYQLEIDQDGLIQTKNITLDRNQQEKIF